MSSAASSASARSLITCTGSARPFELDGASIDVGDTVHLPREMRDGRAREDLGGSGDAAQPRREVERPAAIAALDGDGLAGVQPDPDRERERRLRDGLVDEPALELDRRSDRLPGRVEDHERLVTAELHDGPAAGLDALARDSGELAGERRGGLVAALLREDGVATHIGDQERPDRRVAALVTPHGLWALPRLLLQDPTLQLLKLRRRIDPQLVGQELPRLPERVERLRLAPGAIPGEHQVGPQALAERMLADRAVRGRAGPRSAAPCSGARRQGPRSPRPAAPGAARSRRPATGSRRGR